MFKIHDDKVYFVAETPDINKVIEIFLPKDDRGTIMDSHEIRVDLCRAVIHMEKKGVRVLKVRNIEDTNKASIDIWHTLSIQASGMHYCIPNEDLSDGNYSKVELSYLSEEVEEFLPFAEDDEAPLATVYGYVPVETVDAVLAKHGGIVNV